MIAVLLALVVTAQVSWSLNDTQGLLQLIQTHPRGTVLILPGPHVCRVASTMSFDAVSFQNGAVLAPEKGVTLEMNGPIRAEAVQILIPSKRVYF